MPKLASVPAKNKDGFSKVTFLGYEDITKVYESTDKKTGEKTEVEREYTKLKFEIMDKTKVDPIKANVIGQALNERELFETVVGLGYVATESDDDLEESDDDLESNEADASYDELASIVSFLDSIKGKHFFCKVERDKRGYWAIDPKTLAPFVSKAK